MLLIDVSAIVCRAFYGDQERAGANLMLMVDTLMRGAHPTYAAAVHDSPGKTWRHDIYPQYKAKRKKKEDALVRLLQLAPKVFEYFGVMSIAVPGFEADDVIASLAKKHAGEEPLIWSSDKDFYQLMLIAGVYDPIKDRIVTTDDLQKKFGVTDPLQVVEVQSLMGDTADNIPGCPGVGLKKASKLIGEYGTTQAMYNDGVKALKGATRQKVIDNMDKVAMSLELARLRFDVIVPELDALKVGPRVDVEGLQEELGL